MVRRSQQITKIKNTKIGLLIITVDGSLKPNEIAATTEVDSSSHKRFNACSDYYAARGPKYRLSNILGKLEIPYKANSEDKQHAPQGEC